MKNILTIALILITLTGCTEQERPLTEQEIGHKAGQEMMEQNAIDSEKRDIEFEKRKEAIDKIFDESQRKREVQIQTQTIIDANKD